MDIYEILEYPLPRLSLKPPEIIIEASGKYEGSFFVENIGGSHVSGTVFAKDKDLVNITDKEFDENKARIRFSADLSSLKNDEIINTHITVSSNGGEMILPITMKSMPYVLETIGDFRITSLREFYNCAKQHETETTTLFYSNKFRQWLKHLAYKHIDVYDTIIKDTNIGRALKNFFVLNKFEDPAILLSFILDVKESSSYLKKNSPGFSINLQKSEFANHEKGYVLIKNSDNNEITVSASSDQDTIKFDRQDVKVKNQTKLYFFARLTTLQIAQLGIRRLPFFKDKICVKIDSVHGPVEEYFDVTVGEVSFKGQENQVASGLKLLLDYRITGNIEHLKKAMTIAEKLVNGRKLSVPYLLYSSLVFIEADDIETALSILNSVAKHRAYYRSNNPEIYGTIMFLLALCDLRRGRSLDRSREMKTLEEYEIEYDHFIFPLALGVLALEKGNTVQAGEYFVKCYKKGCHSSYLAGYLYKFFQKESEPGTEQILNWFINWALTKDVDIRNVIMRNKKILADDLFFKGGTLYKLYDKYKQSFLLEVICKSHIARGDFGKNEYEYYKRAEQLQIDGIYKAIVKSAENLNDEDISRNVIIRFLEDSVENDSSIAFVYHLIITERKFADLLSVNKQEIIEFGKRAIRVGKKGRSYCSLYKYMLDASSNDTSLKAYVEELDQALFDGLFSYSAEFENKSVTHIWISEKESNDARVYAVTGGHTRIKILTDDFDYVCYDIHKAVIVDAKPKIRKIIENVDIETYLYLYRKEYFSDEMLISLSSHILNKKTAPEDALSILKQSAHMRNISDEFKMQICAEIANIMCKKGDYEEAFDWYLTVDDQYVAENHITSIIESLAESHSYDKLCWFINKRLQIISDEDLLKAINQIAENSMFSSHVAREAFKLLIRRQYSPSALDTVIKYYKGGIGEYEELFEALMDLGIMSIEIAEIVVENGAYCPPMSQTSQKAFANLYKVADDKKNKCIELFTYCCIYEIIAKGTKLTFEAIETLEKIYEEGKDKLLSYALCTFYCETGMRSVYASKILNDAAVFMEEDGIILPAMKKCRLDELVTPYVQKKQPFLYRSNPGASVLLYYKFTESEEFKVKPMKYLRFGIYLASVTMFYGEQIIYCISEEMRSGSILTKEEVFINNSMIGMGNLGKFSDINKCLMYLEKSRFDKAEAIIEGYLKPPKTIVGKMINI
ncbi:MAG: DUF5717 family protein [Defluviitaleaceae bacterium]|nr:DUF5717 family protein [Defluviitaleaceae bacterium]